MAEAPSQVAGQDTAEPNEGGLFGLDAGEDRLLGELVAEAAASFGLDGNRIYAALRQGKPLGEALGLPSGIVEALYARAHNWFVAGRPDQAERLFRVLCVLDSRSADHWVGYGVCLSMRDNRREAELAFATAAAIRPDWGVPYFHAAELAVAGERWALAAEHVRAFQQRQAGMPEAMRREAARLAKALAGRTTLSGSSQAGRGA